MNNKFNGTSIYYILITALMLFAGMLISIVLKAI